MLFFKPKDSKFGDFSLIMREDKLYTIYIQRIKGQKNNSYGLAVTNDYVNWKCLGKIMSSKNCLWANDIIEKNNEYLMFYSEVDDVKEDDHYLQRVSLATSTDLKKWNPQQTIIQNTQTEPFYYPNSIHKFCWRDPHIFQKDEVYYCTLAAKDISKPYEKSGCVALLKSSDLLNWETLPPLFSPGNYWEIETPNLYTIFDKQIIIFGSYRNGMSMQYAIGKTIDDLHEPEFNTITPSLCYAGKIIKVKDEYLFYHWIKHRKKGDTIRYLAPPKLVELQNNLLLLKKYPLIDGETISFTGEYEIDGTTIRRTKAGILVSEYGSSYVGNIKPRELRTIPIDGTTLELVKENNIIEIYLDNYFIYAKIQ